MNLAGIDGCAGGWIVTRYIEGKYDIKTYVNFNLLMSDNDHLDRVLIDIPVGLSSQGFPRTIESKMRKELENRSSTVFNAPCRAAVQEPDHGKARNLNKEIEGKSLSLQSLFIKGKIQEVDDYLCNTKSTFEIIESHPELCFKYLNNGIVQSKKSKAEGIVERLEIIKRFDPKFVQLYDKALIKIKRKVAKKDDIIDSICLCLVNKLGYENQLSYLIDNNATDEKGIEIKIGYYRG